MVVKISNNKSIKREYNFLFLEYKDMLIKYKVNSSLKIINQLKENEAIQIE